MDRLSTISMRYMTLGYGKSAKEHRSNPSVDGSGTRTGVREGPLWSGVQMPVDQVPRVLRLTLDGTGAGGSLHLPVGEPLGGVVVFHGRASSQKRHREAARRLSAAGIACLTYD